MQYYQDNNGGDFDFSYQAARRNQLRGLRRSLTALGLLLIIYNAALIGASTVYSYLYASIHSGSLMLDYNEVRDYIRQNIENISITEFEMLGNAFVVLVALIVTVGVAAIFMKFDFKSVLTADKEQVLIGVKAFPFAMLINYIFTTIAAVITAQFASVGVTIPEADFFIDRPTALAGISMFLYSVILAPVIEEIVYRGFVIKLISPYGKTLAVILSAFIFGLMHGNLSQFMSAFSTGIIYALVAVSTGSILPTIVMHMLNNLPNFLYMASDTYGVKAMEIIYAAVLSCVLLVGIMEIFLYFKKFLRRPSRDNTVLTAKERFIAIITNPAMIVYFIYLCYEFIGNIIKANA